MDLTIEIEINFRYGSYGRFKRITQKYDILLAIAAERSYHPIRDCFDALPAWDVVTRVETLFIDYLGSPNTTSARLPMADEMRP